MGKMEELQDKVTGYAAFLFNKYRNPALVYHNISHTLRVVKHVTEIERHYHLSAREKFILLTAAWLHDIGHLFGEMKEHEKKSVEIMQVFLANNNCDREIINQVAACVMVTKFPSNPASLIEQILCDADTYHLGTDEFPQCDELVKKEMLLRGVEINEWDIYTLAFLQKHKYFTTYCQQLLNNGKLENIRMLQSRVKNKV